MARAKRTDRAEARRRYRASIGEPLTDDEVESTDAESPAVRRTTSGAAPSGTAAAAPAASRPGGNLGGAFRSSFRSIDLRADLQALPQLLRHWSFYVPVVLAGLAVVLGQYFPREPLVTAFVGYFSGLTPFGSVFIAGFFAPRASYLVGGLVSLAAAGFLALSYTVQFSGLPDGRFVEFIPGAPLISTEELKAQYPAALIQAATAGTIYGALFASAAAWYRRFLNRANPNRAARSTTPTGRRPDGKIPKRNEQRPILARRR